jgi:3-hydroxyanthranilate 3,4-dioxygenase
MVVERMREEKEIDHLRWFCESCGNLLHDATFHCKDLGTQLKPIIEGFFADVQKRTCTKCGTVLEPPQPAKAV